MINFNGNIVDESNQLSNNRGFLFGDAVFETLRVISVSYTHLTLPTKA